MPVEPPPHEAAVRNEPVFLTDDDVADLASFTGMDERACLDRVRFFSTSELAEAWHAADPKTPDEIVRFYQSTDLYIWDLMQWHASVARRRYWDALEWLKHQRPSTEGWSRVLDLGSGVGTDAIYLARHGYEVTLMDVPGPTLAFARHRFERRGLPVRVVETTAPVPNPPGDFDIVIAFDVFEHLPDPLSAARRVAASLRPGGLLVQTGHFGDDGDHPCHLSDGVSRFSGLRWHIYLAGLGLRTAHTDVYEKPSGPASLAQRMRFSLWRLTQLWLVDTRRM